MNRTRKKREEDPKNCMVRYKEELGEIKEAFRKAGSYNTKDSGE